jgi:environmental stress-induced protein Ves
MAYVYSYRLIPRAAQKTSAWSGGTTTELAIFLEDASYAARNFQWRLSTAIVTAEESTFTALPDWHRLLMVLAGSMQLTHAGHHQVTLQPFEQDSFSGNWSTHCVGQGQDFNLMLAAGWQGRLQTHTMAEGEKVYEIAISDGSDGSTEAFYCFAGQLKAHLSLPLLPSEASDSEIDVEVEVHKGDFLLLQPIVLEEKASERGHSGQGAQGAQSGRSGLARPNGQIGQSGHSGRIRFSATGHDHEPVQLIHASIIRVKKRNHEGA